MPKLYEIHPAIGIARVGSSDEFVLGPEPGGAPPTSYRDGSGLLKRQAARFRVFECERDNQGKLVSASEMTPDKATIIWEVHLVNRKAAAPRFLTPGSSQPSTNPSVRRNGATGSDQSQPDVDLIIDPGSRSLSGINQGPALFNTGKFKGAIVPLGELRTDATGRLIVVGGFGKSEAIPATAISNFADNNNWHDDTADGPVRATVQLANGPAAPVDRPAWVLACQPDFAPGISNLVTLYDVLCALAVQRSLLAPPAPVAFDAHVWPILQRVLGYQWVNQFAAAGHGPGGLGDFTAPHWKDIADPTKGAALRKHIFRLLRNPTSDQPPPVEPAMPRLFSDGYPDDPLPLPLTIVQYQIMQAWADGQFVTTRPGGGPAESLPDAMTRVALEACAGGACYPGIEAGRRMRDTSIYMDGEAFRLSHQALRPGEITQSMALPWQADFFACTWEGDDESGHGWWPAQRPDDVFVGNGTQDSKSWSRGVHNMREMVDNWDKLGVVVPRTDALGKTTFVETERDPNGVLGQQ